MLASRLLKLSFVLLILLIVTLPLTAYAVEYREYKRDKGADAYFKIEVIDKTVKFSSDSEDIRASQVADLKDLRHKNNQVFGKDKLLIDGLTVFIKGNSYSLSQIIDTRILGEEDSFEISFLIPSAQTDRTDRVKQGNLIDNATSLTVEQDQFIRGIVLNAAGDIEIYGEVNKDVIALAGDIYLGPGAVVRGDIVSVTGRVDYAKDASVYGEIYSAKDGRKTSRGRFSEDEEAITHSFNLEYNRVDGLSILSGLEYRDYDSLLPSVWASGGYAFESERWRYDFGIEQVILRNPALSISGSLYRQLASDDDWIITTKENTPFALLVTEDFRDYYEAEGGLATLTIKPIKHLTFKAGYRYEETKWIEATPRLWSLFGSHKRFGLNFARVDEPFRSNSINQIDTTSNATISTRIEYDAHDSEDPFDASAWNFSAEFEWSHPDLNSDFDYHRYRLNLRRYQAVTDNSMLLLRSVYGNSDGFLPMYKRFYLGGYGTMWGYKHKEFMGTEFWMTNAEYRVDFPGNDLAVSLMWDMAQIANDTTLSSDIEIKHDLGIGIYFGSDVKLNIAKRLDRSYNDDPKFYVQFTHSF